MSEISTTIPTTNPLIAPSNDRLQAAGVTSRLSPRTIAAILFFTAFAIYNLSAIWSGRTHSPNAAYFNYLADAFLHGRLYVLNTPSLNDLTLYNGQWYVGFPPLAALLLIPWVALSGLRGVNTVVFNAFIGATNVVLVFLVLQSLVRRGWSRLSVADNLWLTVLFGLGSVHWYMSTMGAVWFLGQICATPFILLAVLFAINSRSPLLTGSAFAIAMLSRPHVAFSYPVLAGIAFQNLWDSGSIDWRKWIKWVAVSVIPIALIVMVSLGYNYARFNSFSDFGYMTMNVDESVKVDLLKWGQFHWHYFLHNFYTMFLQGPDWNKVTGRIVPDENGMSVLLTTPAFLLLFRVRRRWQPFIIGAALAVVSMLVPLLTYYNTGWLQFGNRFSLDFMVPLLLLMTIVAEKSGKLTLRALILLGVLVNFWGVWWYRFYV